MRDEEDSAWSKSSPWGVSGSSAWSCRHRVWWHFTPAHLACPGEPRFPWDPTPTGQDCLQLPAFPQACRWVPRDGWGLGVTVGAASPWGFVSALCSASPAWEGAGQSPQMPKTPVHPKGAEAANTSGPRAHRDRPGLWSLQKTSQPEPGFARGARSRRGLRGRGAGLPLRVPGTPGRSRRTEAAARELPEHSALRLGMGGWNGVTEGRLRGFQDEASGNRAADTAEGWALSRAGEVQGATVEAGVGTLRPARDSGWVPSCQLWRRQGPPGGSCQSSGSPGDGTTAGPGRCSETPTGARPLPQCPRSGRRVPWARGQAG